MLAQRNLAVCGQPPRIVGAAGEIELAVDSVATVFPLTLALSQGRGNRFGDMGDVHRLERRVLNP